MHPSRLTNETLRARSRLYYREEPYYNPPSLSSSTTAYLHRHHPHGLTREETEDLYNRSIDRLLDENEADVSDGDDEGGLQGFPSDLTRLQLLLEYSQRTKFVICLLTFPRYFNEQFFFVVPRTLLLFAILQGADGPNIPFALVKRARGEISDGVREQESFRLGNDEELGDLEEVVIAPYGSRICKVAKTLRRWVDKNEDRALMYSLFRRLPVSKLTIEEARHIMNPNPEE